MPVYVRLVCRLSAWHQIPYSAGHLYAKGHKYLPLVYQIDLGITRLLWVGKERTVESFQGFFTMIGEGLTSKIVFICSDMWEPYLKLVREKCAEALHILDRFHIVAKMNKAPRKRDG